MRWKPNSIPLLLITLRAGALLHVTGALLALFAPSIARATTLSVEPAEVRLYVNAAQQLLVTELADPPQDATHTATYECVDPAIASVSSDGQVRGLAAGATYIDVTYGGQQERVRVIVEQSTHEPAPRFATEIVPVLTRLGCNSGGCHGKATGQNGFRLSLLGFEPEFDYDSLVHEARGRRLFPGDPMHSLLLRKATAQTPHGGGRRLAEDSDDYRLLARWIEAGAPPPRDADPQLLHIEMSPPQRVLAREAMQQLRVTAHFSDGTTRDVTRQAVYESNEPEIAEVDLQGLVRTHARTGLVAVMARFGEQIATFRATIPLVSDRGRAAMVVQKLDVLEPQLRGSVVDRHLLAQWRQLAVVPSPVADDVTFLRRASLDICGTLPTPAEVEAYVADSRPDKKRRLIDRLLDRPEYASYFALKWADILQNRGAGYSTSQQRAGTALFAAWIRDALAENKPYNQFVAEILTASGSQRDNPPTLWYRSVRKSPEYVESVAQAFLGVRIQCAQCHHHPAERWSQADYYGLAAVFARVGRKGGFADAEVPTNEIIYVKDRGQVLHPQTGERMAPRALGGPVFDNDPFADPRQQLVRWMTHPDNPFFARTLVNRLWAHFLGRGIIHPIDDARSTNPPSNPELLDALAAEFIASGYDMKHMVRVITTSYAYGLAASPNEWNAGDAQTFARFYPRRLPAEVLLDGISQVLGVPTVFPGGPGEFPLGTRAIELPDENVAAHFLDVFGRPARMTACECERVDAPALTQALELVNSEEIHRKLTADNGYVQQVVASNRPHKELVREIFLRVLGRPPEPEQEVQAVQFLASEPDRAEAYRSLVWSLLATNEFLFNH